MAHNKLSDRTCRTARPGMHGDGGSLYLRVASKTARSWVFLYRVGEKRTELGLGPYPAVTLSQARQDASECRAARAQGITDLKSWRRTRTRAYAPSHSPTFAAVAEEMLAAKSPGWTSKHAAEHRKSLMVDAVSLHTLPIAAVDTKAVLTALTPRWLATPDTAKRLRLRIESTLDYAKAKGLRQGENPARWRGHLKNLLPKQTRQTVHHAAMAYRDVPQFLTTVRGISGYGALALQLLILTAARTGEIVGARWDEFDLAAKVWTIPAARMKARREHRVPLSDPALDILRELWEVRRSHFLFPSHDASRHASKMLMAHIIERHGTGQTVHGYRSAFRDWAGEQTSFPREVIEMSLAHVVGTAAERAYARSDLFERRRQLMEAWADFLTRPAGPANVVLMLR